jgi:hypothetical protein
MIENRGGKNFFVVVCEERKELEGAVKDRFLKGL